MTMAKKVSSEILSFVNDTLGQSGTGEVFLEKVRLQLRARVQADIWFLAYHILNYKDIDNDLHHEMCYIWDKRKHRRVTLWLIPRGHLKTTLWTISDIIQEKLNDPNHRHLLTNAKLENAESMLAEVRGHFETNVLLRWLFPEYCWDLAPKSDRDRCKITVGRLDFPCRTVWKKEGNIEVMSVGASLVSKHFDKITFDDMVNDKLVDNAEVRQGNYDWYRNALQLRDRPSTPIRIIGTRWHFDDPYGRLLRKEESYRKQQRLLGERKARMLSYVRTATEPADNGVLRPIWPERFTLSDLAEIKDDIGSYIYSCQYENNPLPDESAIFKRDQLQEIYPWEMPKNVQYFIGTDLADEDTKKGDYSAIVVIAVDETGRVFVEEVIRGKIFTLEFVDLLIDLCKKYNPIRVAVETNAFQKSIYKYWKKVSRDRGAMIPWKECYRTSAKFRRILQLQPVVERGDFFIIEGMTGKDHMILEMVEYTGKSSAYDDCLDALQSAYECSFEVEELDDEEPPGDSAAVIFDQLFGAWDGDDEDEGAALVGNGFAI